MKYRRNKVKREHGIIENALEWLEELSRLPVVTDIIPGVIEVSRSPERGIVYKYPTQTGCKLLLKSNGSIQEAFVVTKAPEAVREWVESRFPASQEKTDPLPAQDPNAQPAGKTVAKPNAEPNQKMNEKPDPNLYLKSDANRSLIMDNRPFHVKKHSKSSSLRLRRNRQLFQDIIPYGEENMHLGELDPPNVGQRLNASTRRALRALQKELDASAKHQPTKRSSKTR